MNKFSNNNYYTSHYQYEELEDLIKYIDFSDIDYLQSMLEKDLKFLKNMKSNYEKYLREVHLFNTFTLIFLYSILMLRIFVIKKSNIDIFLFIAGIYNTVKFNSIYKNIKNRLYNIEHDITKTIALLDYIKENYR